MNFLPLFLIGFLLLTVQDVSAQKKVRLQPGAKEMRSGKKGNERYDRVIGDVVFVQNKTTI